MTELFQNVKTYRLKRNSIDLNNNNRYDTHVTYIRYKSGIYTYIHTSRIIIKYLLYH